jgi:hypothetical protein
MVAAPVKLPHHRSGEKPNNSWQSRYRRVCGREELGKKFALALTST